MNVDLNRPSPSDPMVALYAHSSRIDENVLDDLLTKNSELKEMHLEHCNLLPADWFAKACFPSTLQYIDVSCTAIDDRGVLNIFSRCRRLIILHMYACSAITKDLFSSSLLPTTLRVISFYETGIDPDSVYKIFSSTMHANILASKDEKKLVNFQFNSPRKRSSFKKIIT